MEVIIIAISITSWIWRSIWVIILIQVSWVNRVKAIATYAALSLIRDGIIWICIIFQ